MKSFFALALAATAAALPTADTKSQVANTTVSFTGLAIRSGSDIQYAAVAANGFAFWLNKDTSTYTPSVAPVNFNRTTNTVFSFYLPGDTLSLDVSVPGGQTVYVDAAGALKFTIPHGSAAGDKNVTFRGFQIAQGHLLFENSSFIAVPTTNASNIPDNKGTAYKIYAASRTNLTGLGFAFRAFEAANSTVTAWEYI